MTQEAQAQSPNGISVEEIQGTIAALESQRNEALNRAAATHGKFEATHKKLVEAEARLAVLEKPVEVKPASDEKTELVLA
jgi:hypothetical protein